MLCIDRCPVRSTELVLTVSCSPFCRHMIENKATNSSVWVWCSPRRPIFDGQPISPPSPARPHGACHTGPLGRYGLFGESAYPPPRFPLPP